MFHVEQKKARSAESEEGMPKKVTEKKGEVSPAKKSADTITIRCGNDECLIKGECRRYQETCEVKLVCRKRKCEHFLSK